MKINKKYILPANGNQMVFHEELESTGFNTDRKAIKSTCEMLHNLEEYPLLFAQIEDDIHNINDSLGTNNRLNEVLSEIVKRSEVKNNNELTNDNKNTNKMGMSLKI